MVALFSCGDSGNNGTGQGYAPGNIVGKTLVLKSNKGTVYLSTEHLNESALVVNSHTIDYLDFPPSYSYETIKNNEAFYYLQLTRKTYIPYYQMNSYSRFSFSINLTFASESTGSYKGIETNSAGKNKDISGTFTLK